MKLSPVLLAGSLAANLALVAILLLAPRDPATVASAANVAPAPTLNPQPSTLNSSVTPASLTAADLKAWSKLSVADLDALIPRLRAAGFPQRVIAQIVTMTVWERYSDREFELTRDQRNTPYWQRQLSAYNDPKIAAELTKLEIELTETLSRLLGPGAGNFDDNPEGLAMRRIQYGNLSAEKIQKLTSIQQDYDKLRRETMPSFLPGNFTPADREKLAALQKAQRADIVAALTPDELAEYDLHASGTASSMRYAMGGNGMAAMKATEAEYRAVFPFFLARDEQFAGIYGNYTPEQQAARTAADEKLKEQLKSALSPERYADYEFASNYSNNQLIRLTERLGLPFASARQVTDIQKDVQQQASAIRRNTALSAADRDASLSVLAQQATGKVTSILGPRGVEAYKQYGGKWLTSVTAAPPPPK